jgi:ribosomal protein S18 acetylase RimI-like enzyme
MCRGSEPGLDHTPFEVRPFQPGDSEAVLEICRQSPEAAQWPKESYHRAHSSGQIVLVAEGNDGIRGFLFARITVDEAEILNTAVNPAHRRKGVGGALLSAAISAMPKAFISRSANPMPRPSLFMESTVLKKQQSVARTTVVLQKTP